MWPILILWDRGWDNDTIDVRIVIRTDMMTRKMSSMTGISYLDQALRVYLRSVFKEKPNSMHSMLVHKGNT